MNGYRFEHLPQHPGLRTLLSLTHSPRSCSEHAPHALLYAGAVVDYDKDDTDNKVARYTIKRKREEATSPA